MKAVAFGMVLAAAPLACTSNETTNADGDGSEGTSIDGSSTGGATDDDGETSAAAESSGDGSGGDASTDDGPNDDDAGDESGPIEPPPATGIQIVDITADQGVMIPIALDGALVGPADRSTAILKNRPLMLRAIYELDEGWTQRAIFGRLFVEQTDGRVTEYTNYVDVYPRDCEAGESRIDCVYGTLPATFFWKVEAEDVQPGATYRIELFETAPGHENDVSDKVPVFPTDGSSLEIGIEDSYMKMRVVVVPFDHDIGAQCPEPPDLLEAVDEERTVADLFAERLMAHNPVDEVEIIVHEVERYTGSLQGSQLLQTLQQLRFAEGAPPEYYYYGVARPCDGGPDFAGVAQLGGPTQGQAAQRVGWGVYYQNTGTTAETFVHEIGHEQGRAHIACNGEEGGPDPSYPDHPEGDTENFGTDLFGPSIKVNNKAAHDYMTYCSSTWVSEWGWNRVAPWIATISAWETQAPSAEPERLLVGNIHADGSEDWYVTMGHAPEPTGSDTVRFTIEGAAIEERRAHVVQWERSEDLNVIVPLPADPSAVTELSWRSSGRARPIDRAAIRMVGPVDLAAR